MAYGSRRQKDGGRDRNDRDRRRESGRRERPERGDRNARGAGPKGGSERSARGFDPKTLKTLDKLYNNNIIC